MKRLLTLTFIALLATSAFGQNSDQMWSIGLFGGKTEYVGELGNGFMVWDPWVYGHAGVSASRYINSSLDLGLQFEYGSYGYWIDELENFFAKKADGALLLKYKFNNGYILGEDFFLAPFIASGFGFASFAGEKEEADRTAVDDLDAFIPVGAGIKFNITPTFSMQYQFLYNFTNGDTRDLNTTDEKNDRFMSHSIGISFNL